jgi:tetratricopeptide (TPR) repeat protein
MRTATATALLVAALAGPLSVGESGARAEGPAAPSGSSEEGARRDAGKHTKALYELGMKLYNLGEFQQALEQFKAAYLEKAEPLFLFDIGQCYRRMGNHEKALEAYRSYLREAPGAKNRAAVEKFIVDAEAALAEDRRRAAQPPIAVQPPQGPVAPEPAATPEAKPLESAPPVESRPLETREVPAAALPAANAPATAQPERRSRKGLWIALGVVGGVVVAGVAIGLGVGLTSGNTTVQEAVPMSTLGTFMVGP